MKSPYLTINVRDLVKGAAVAAGTVMLSLIGTMIESGASITEEQLITSVKVGVLAAISYLIKNVFTNSQDQMFKSEQK
jgi:hypothetical protein